MLTGVRNNTRGLKITREDSAGLVVQFTNGEQIAGIRSQRADTVSHLLVTSAHAGSQPNAAALVMDSAARVQGNERGVRAGEVVRRSGRDLRQ